MSDGIRARFFDADGHDRVVELGDLDRKAVGKRQLLWIDLDLDAGASLDAVADWVPLSDIGRSQIEADTGRSRMIRGADRLHLTLEATEVDDPKAARPELVRREIDLIAVPGVVVTAHRGPVAALERFDAGLSGETMLGVLDAADLLSSLADEVISGYHDVAESIEKDIDRLDQRALRGDRNDTVLSEIVAIRRRISIVRRTLAPHRSALAALGRPEMRGVDESLGEPWPGLAERLDVAAQAIESLREALLGTYDIHMGRSAQRANDVMKALTLVSAVFLPAVVLAGIMGMNFKLPFFDEPNNFFLVCGVMAVIAIGLLVAARWRRWI